MILSNNLIRAAMAERGLKAAPGKLHIAGIRQGRYISGSQITGNRVEPDKYDDSIVLFGTFLRAYKGTTDPGGFYTKNPLNPDGAARLVTGKTYKYHKGLHRKKWALVQAASVTVVRDIDRDFEIDPTDPIDKGWFGVNIHAGGASEAIGKNGAGCQVLWGGWEGSPWLDFKNRVYEVLPTAKSVIEYHMLDVWDLQKVWNAGVR